MGLSETVGQRPRLPTRYNCRMSPEISSLHRHRVLGFTLVELAVVIAVVALLLGALMVPLTTQGVVDKLKSTLRDMKEIRQALLGFGITNHRLPCPSSEGEPNTCTDWRINADSRLLKF